MSLPPSVLHLVLTRHKQTRSIYQSCAIRFRIWNWIAAEVTVSTGTAQSVQIAARFIGRAQWWRKVAGNFLRALFHQEHQEIRVAARHRILTRDQR